MPPTKTELFTQLSNAIKIFDQEYKFAAENAINYIALETALIESLEGDHARVILNTINSVRNSLNSIYLSGTNILTPILQQIARVAYAIAIDGLSIDQVITQIFEQMELATDTIASRVLTFGTIVVGGSNQTTGTIYRTALDRNNDNIESGQEGIVRFDVVLDKNNGVRPGREQIRAFGSGITKIDEVDIGTATNQVATFLFHRSDNGILKNSSFNEIEDSITKADQVGWTLGSALSADYEKVTDVGDIFRFTPGQETALTQTGAALRLKLNNTSVVQYFTRNRLAVADNPDTPMFLVFRVKRENLADGTLTIRLGQSTNAVTVTTLTNNAYNDVIIGPGTDDGYFANFNEDFVDTATNQALGVRIEASWTGRTIGELVLDEVVFQQAQLFNGIFYLAVAGSNTDGTTSGEAKRGDFFTFSDTTPDTGRNQFTLSRLYNRHLPHSGTPTFADA